MKLRKYVRWMERETKRKRGNINVERNQEDGQSKDER
jgi:hypothetical protein